MRHRMGVVVYSILCLCKAMYGAAQHVVSNLKAAEINVSAVFLCFRAPLYKNQAMASRARTDEPLVWKGNGYLPVG